MNGSQDGIMGYHPQNVGYPLGTTLPSSRPPGAAPSLLLPLAVPSLASRFLLTLMLPGGCSTSISGVGGSSNHLCGTEPGLPSLSADGETEAQGEGNRPIEGKDQDGILLFGSWLSTLCPTLLWLRDTCRR